MDNRQLVDLITKEVMKVLKENGLLDEPGSGGGWSGPDTSLLDLTSKEYKDTIQIKPDGHKRHEAFHHCKGGHRQSRSKAHHQSDAVLKSRPRYGQGRSS